MRDSKGRFIKGQKEFHFPKGKKNPKLSQVRKDLYSKGKLPSVAGKNNPMYGKSLTDKQKQALSLGRGRKGSDSPSWQGGKTALQKKIRNSEKYKQWVSDVFKRDNWTCQTCQKRGGLILNAHHSKELNYIIKEYNLKTFEDALKCEELWNINNGITLCFDCHQKTKHSYLIIQEEVSR